VVNDYFRHKLAVPGSKQLPLWRQMLAGGGAGFCQIIVTTPMELLKIQLQDAGRVEVKGGVGAVQKQSALTITMHLLKTKGIAGLYKGTGATMARDVTFSMIYFPLFATLDALGPRKKDGSGDAQFWATCLAGVCAGAFSSFSVTPIDVVKTRIQLLKRAEGEAAYNGMADAFGRILKNEGIRAFFKGAACRMMVVAPLFGIAQTVYFFGVAELILGIDKSKQIRH